MLPCLSPLSRTRAALPEAWKDEPQLRLTRTAENEEDELVRARKRKSPAGAGGGGSRKGSKGKLLESDRSTVCVACSFLPGHVLASNLF